MSLLMDALKRAELAKRQGRAEDDDTIPAHAQPGLTLDPLPEVSWPGPAAVVADPAAVSQTPADPSSLAAHLEALDAEFLADAQLASAAKQRARPGEAEPASSQEPFTGLLAVEPRITPAPAAPPPKIPVPPAAAPASPERQKASVQNLFAAKQAPAASATASASAPASNKRFGLILGGLTALAVLAIAAYFWWQLQPRKPGLPFMPAPAPLAASSPAPPPPAPAPVPAAPPPAAVATVAEADADEDERIHLPASPPARATPRPRVEPPPAALPTPATGAENPLHLTRTPLRVHPGVAQGFDAFGQNRLSEAQAAYEQVLQQEPRNLDALHGLAAIALRRQQPERADELYQRLLEIDPQDAVAQVAVINARAQGDPALAEARLRQAANRHPDLAAPHAALGNLLARQSRWSEAQQAYFRAFTADPENPDLLYNLAVSLEHLRQPKLAAQYYAQALALAEGRASGFDRARARARLLALQP